MPPVALRPALDRARVPPRLPPLEDRDELNDRELLDRDELDRDELGRDRARDELGRDRARDELDRERDADDLERDGVDRDRPDPLDLLPPMLLPRDLAMRAIFA